jgi:hypothetical protein
MPLKEWNGSNWQVVAQIKVWNGSSWVALNNINNAKTARVWNGSSWVQFHPGVQLEQDNTSGTGTISLDSSDIQFSPDPAYATVSIYLYSSGAAEYITSSSSGTYNQNYNWLLSGANSDYYAWMDTQTGNAFTSGTVNTALQLDSIRVWSLEAVQNTSGSVFKSLTSTLRIKNSSGTDIISIPVSLSVSAVVY